MVNGNLSKKVSADQYYVTKSRAQVQSSSRLRDFYKLAADQLLVPIGWWARAG